MGCRDGFSAAGLITKVALIVVFVSLFCSWIAFTTTSWLVAGNYYWGLWRLCVNDGSLIQTCALLDGTAKVEYGVTQAFASIGFMFQNVGFLLVLLYIFKESCRANNEVGMGSAILLILSAVGWFISVAVLGGKYNNYIGENTKLHYSYGLAVIACGLGLIGGVLMFLTFINDWKAKNDKDRKGAEGCNLLTVVVSNKDVYFTLEILSDLPPVTE